MIEPEFVLEFEILLLDGPSVMRQPDEGAQRGGRREATK